MEKAVSDKLNQFFAQYKSSHCRKGELLITPHNLLSTVFFLKKGYIRQYAVSRDGEEFTLHTYKPLSILPLALVLGSCTNTYYFEAATPAEIHVAPVEEVVQFIKENPDVLFDLTSRFAAGLCGYLERMKHIMFEDAYMKVISLLVYLGKYFGQKKEGKVIIELPLPHRSIATWIGVSRETVSRQIEKLKTQGIIANHTKQLVILDYHKLKQKQGLHTPPNVLGRHLRYIRIMTFLEMLVK